MTTSSSKMDAARQRSLRGKKSLIQCRDEVRDDVIAAQYMARKIDSCEERGIPFDLTVAEIRELLTVTHCQYTGIEFDPNVKGHSWTLERVNSCEGYNPNNVVVVTDKANSHKSSLDQFVKTNIIPDEMKIKLLRKATYQLEKKLKGNK